MKDYFKYGVLLIITLTIAYVCLTLRDCRESGQTSAVVVTPADPTFSPITYRNYKPASTPFEKPIKPPVKLPKGVRERDVKNVLIIVKAIPIKNDLPFVKGETSRGDSSARDRGVRVQDTTAVITMKDGRVFVGKQNGEVQSVDLFTYQSPILDFDLFVSLGITVSQFEFSPAVTICPLQICGTIQIPMLAADLYGIGAGGSYRWNNFSLGILVHYEFDMNRQLKLSLTYNL